MKAAVAATALVTTTMPARVVVTNPATRPMKIAVKAKSAPKRRGSPSRGPRMVPAQDQATQFTQNTAPEPKK